MTSRFASWDARYGQDEFFYGTAPNTFLEEVAPRLPAGAEILCLAEGEGRNAVFLASLGHRVTAVDGSAVGLAKAARLAASRGTAIETVVADLETWDLGDARWDAVVSIWCHGPPAFRAGLHPKIARALRPGGVLILEHYHPSQVGRGTGGPPDPTWMPTLEELRASFPGWAEEHAVERERDVREGAGHAGPSAVVQVVLRRPREVAPA